MTSFKISAEHILPLKFNNNITVDVFRLIGLFANDCSLIASVLHYNANIDSFSGENELEEYRKDVPYECKPSKLKMFIKVSLDNLQYKEVERN